MTIGAFNTCVILGIRQEEEGHSEAAKEGLIVMSWWKRKVEMEWMETVIGIMIGGMSLLASVSIPVRYSPVLSTRTVLLTLDAQTSTAASLTITKLSRVRLAPGLRTHSARYSQVSNTSFSQATSFRTCCLETAAALTLVEN